MFGHRQSGAKPFDIQYPSPEDIYLVSVIIAYQESQLLKDFLSI